MKFDLLLANARIADVFRYRLFEGWIGIRDGRFIAVEAGSAPRGISATDTRDLAGRIVMPGLIDSHLHIESSLLTPRRFAEAVLPFGTTTILSDPHEVGNVAGEEGVKWMIAASQDLPLRIYHSIPSCVPATSPELEWTHDVFDAATIRRLARQPSVIALGEVMDYRGLLGPNERLRSIVAAAREIKLLIEGHIPTLAGIELSQYLAHGISSDHTLTFGAKIQEQISKGLAVMLQTKSVTPENMAAVAALPDRSQIILITDDIEPSLLVDGHLSRIVALAIECGMPPLEAIAAASIRPARYLGLRDHGAIAPGFLADFLVMDEIAAFPPAAVFVNGQPMARAGAMSAAITRENPAQPDYPPIPGSFAPGDFKLESNGGDGFAQAQVVALQNKHSTLTELEQRALRLQDGYAQFQADDGLALAAVIARDESSRTVGLIANTGLRAGAWASSVAHDCHNLLVIGRSPEAMAQAANAVHALGGGVAVAAHGDVLASLRLPYFGLLSDEPAAAVARGLADVEEAMRHIGAQQTRPFLTFSIMSLSVSPYAKFTDKGVVDTESRQLIRPFVRQTVR
ncbi:MAG: amidohydrolase family protein [Chloroflexota bacterium]|nr:amidohydrolase family protein [Chloroflexota bacterium]MDE2908248.1 amidohydrolase family protein [Chloroflexota bacterium]